MAGLKLLSFFASSLKVVITSLRLASTSLTSLLSQDLSLANLLQQNIANFLQ